AGHRIGGGSLKLKAVPSCFTLLWQEASAGSFSVVRVAPPWAASLASGERSCAGGSRFWILGVLSSVMIACPPATLYTARDASSPPSGRGYPPRVYPESSRA